MVSPDAVADTFSTMPGISQGAINTLRRFGLLDWKRLEEIDASLIGTLPDITPMEASLIDRVTQQHQELPGFLTSRQVCEQREQLLRVRTGSRTLDELLGGGFEGGGLTEIYGESNAGKTQLIHQALLACALQTNKGGMERHAYLLDTEGTYRPERIDSMLRARDLEDDTIHDRIHVIRTRSHKHQARAMQNILLEEHAMTAGVVAVDSILHHFRADFGNNSLIERQQLLNKHLHDIKHVARVTGAAALITNQVHGVPDAFTGQATSAKGGPTVAHASNYRLQIALSDGRRRILHLRNSPHLPEGQGAARLAPQGIVD